MPFLPSFRLDGRVALVTGASRGIGRHLALALAEAGADLAIVARDDAALGEVAAEARTLGRRVATVGADVSRVSAIQPMVDRVVGELGGIDLLVNNAGTNVQQPALEVTEATWDQVLDLNLKGAFFVAQEVGRQMIAQGRGGRIVNISSQMGTVGFYQRAAYCASKGGLVQISKVLAIEWAAYGIRVNSVGPTWIDSPLAQRMFEDPFIAEEALRRIPIGRLGRMEEVAAAVVYLCSEGADLVTGHHLLVDGGFTAW
jgi:NAD(P)-dependent dehydrogenase (short-subunit alcohol dehydrogenase family)